METSPDGAPVEPDDVAPTAPLPSPDVLRDALAEEQAEVRRLIDAGASSPEDIRALASRMREQREREASVWASEVKPALVKARKGRLRFDDLRRDREESDTSQRTFFLVAGAAVLVALVVLSVLHLSWVVVVIPVAGFLGYAWWLGSRPDPASGPESPPGDEAPLA